MKKGNTLENGDSTSDLKKAYDAIMKKRTKVMRAVLSYSERLVAQLNKLKGDFPEERFLKDNSTFQLQLKQTEVFKMEKPLGQVNELLDDIHQYFVIMKKSKDVMRIIRYVGIIVLLVILFSLDYAYPDSIIIKCGLWGFFIALLILDTFDRLDMFTNKREKNLICLRNELYQILRNMDDTNATAKKCIDH